MTWIAFTLTLLGEVAATAFLAWLAYTSVLGALTALALALGVEWFLAAQSRQGRRRD